MVGARQTHLTAESATIATNDVLKPVIRFKIPASSMERFRPIYGKYVCVHVLFIHELEMCATHAVPSPV